MASRFEPDLEAYERERVVLETIRSNPNLHHNALLKSVVPEFMAKTTFEKTRDSLVEKEIITVRARGNMKFYQPTDNYERKSQQHVERGTSRSFHDLKHRVKRLETDYPHRDVDEKIMIANSLLRNLLRTDNGFTVLDSAKNPKKTLYRDEHLTIQELMHRVFEVIRNDKDFEAVFPALASYLGAVLPQESSDD